MSSLRPLTSSALGLVLGAWLVVSASCGPTVPPYDRAALLREVADQVIVPANQQIQTESEGLDDAATALCAAPSTDALMTAQDAWRATFLAWQRTLAFRFGPARTMNLGPEMAFRPIDTSAIEGEIAGSVRSRPT